MKKSILTIAILSAGLFVSATLITGCGNKKEQSAKEDHHHMDSDSTEHHHDEMAMGYACTMHPEVTGKEGDTCSKCGMKLEPVNADSTKMHTEHEH